MNKKEDSNDEIKSFIAYLFILVGSLILVGGLILGFITFNEAKGLIHDPSPLKKWIELRDVVHTSGTQEYNTINIDNTPPQNSLKEKSHQNMGGYFVLTLGILLIWVLARISIMFIVKGTTIMLKGYQVIKPENTKE